MFSHKTANLSEDNFKIDTKIFTIILAYNAHVLTLTIAGIALYRKE